MKALFITFYFPPLGGAGVQRTLKYVKYLTEQGVSCVVIAAEDPAYTHDESLYNEIPHAVRVFRLASSSFVSNLRKSSSLPLLFHTPHLLLKKIIRKIKPTILKIIQAFQIPDDKHAWAKLAYEEAKNILGKEKFDVIYSSSPPISCHVIAARLKQQFNIPWVADFRDQWTGNPYYNAPLLRRWYDLHLEKSILREADAVTGAHPEMGRIFSKAIKSNNFFYIPNGYDEEDFANVELHNKNTNEFVLVHAGSLYGNRSPSSILKALEYLETSHPDTANRIVLHFVGAIGQDYFDDIKRHQENYSTRVIITPYIEHKKIPSLICNADALLLLVGSESRNSGWIVGKVFEYIRACRPILAIAPMHGDIDRLISSTGWGITFEDNAITEIAETLHKWVQNPLHGISKSDPIISQYDRKNLARKLFLTFQEATKTCQKN